MGFISFGFGLLLFLWILVVVWLYFLMYSNRNEHNQPVLASYVPVLKKSGVNIKISEENATKIKLRYVYDNGRETRFYHRRYGRILGYRITDSLIVHETVAAHVSSRWDVDRVKSLCESRYLTKEEFSLLSKVWGRVSFMRWIAGDKMLPGGFYWIKDGTLEEEISLCLVGVEPLKCIRYSESRYGGSCLFALV